MGDVAGVSAQYTTDTLVARIDRALTEAGFDGPVDWQDLIPLDHFHSRGFAASSELAAALAPARGERVLDVGCGVGGPARLLAAGYGCRVTGIDLTPAAVAAATALSARAGLVETTDFQQGDALELPFPDASFDHAWTQHAAMNISDRARLYAEIHRVLRPNGRFAIHDVVAGDLAPLHFPVPWAATPDVNFMLTAAELREALTTAGFDTVAWEDKTAVTLQGPPPSSPHPALGSFVLAGPDYPNAVQNFLRNLREGRAGVIQAIVTRR